MNKNILNQFFEMFTKLTTVIFIFSSVYISIFVGFNDSLSVKYIWGVLFVALVISVARIPFFSEKERSKRQFLILNIIYFLITNAVVLATGFILHWFTLENPATIIGMEITYVLVFATVWFLIYISIKHSAQKLNDQLKKIKQ